MYVVWGSPARPSTSDSVMPTDSIRKVSNGISPTGASISTAGGVGGGVLTMMLMVIGWAEGGAVGSCGAAGGFGTSLFASTVPLKKPNSVRRRYWLQPVRSSLLLVNMMLPSARLHVQSSDSAEAGTDTSNAEKNATRRGMPARDIGRILGNAAKPYNE